MKKSDLLLIGAVLVIVVIAVFSSRGTVAQEEVDYPLELAGEVGLNEITYSEYKSLVDDEEAFIVTLEREGCGYCQMFMPILKEVANEKKIPFMYIDTDKLTEDEYNELSTTNSYLKKNNWGTPTTLFMLGSRVLDVMPGYDEKEAVLKFIEDKVVIGE